MNMNDIAMIAADTSRSRVYLQALIRNDIIPSYVLILGNKTNTALPGEINSLNYVNNVQDQYISQDCWSEVNVILLESIQVTLTKSSIKYEQLESSNIHDTAVINSINDRPESIFIYSGYGGVILRKELLSINKNFIHVHGGYLPDYKGSTTNYYNLIDDNCMGATSIIMDESIDGGPMLKRKKFPPPPDRTQIDHIYDSAARANVLVETLQEYIKIGKLQSKQNLNKGETYFIIHPILKHIAILSK
jgi:methionyl-tRNA formyltransferase